VAAVADRLEGVAVSFFGVGPSLAATFASDDRLYFDGAVSLAKPSTAVKLLELRDQKAEYEIGGQVFEATLSLGGAYNFLNVAAAMAMVSQILPSKVSADFCKNALAKIRPAFGRGEKILINGRELELVLIKNPSGFRLALGSYDHAGAACMIAINDHFADGRDVSWLWDVDFTTLRQGSVAVVSGTRAYDMALRLRYDEVAPAVIEPKLKSALSHLVNKAQDSMRIFCTYTAMLELRKILSATANLKSFEA
jgi:UDP-N-acetylmuramyl tripeptide synthase